MSPLEFYNSEMDRVLGESIRRHNIAVESLTEKQFIEALRQAILCGDFKRHICVSDGTQTLTYVPHRDHERDRAYIETLKQILHENCIPYPEQ